jgi:hypothetical protein
MLPWWPDLVPGPWSTSTGLFIPKPTTAGTAGTAGTASAATRLAGDRPSVDVRWRPSLAVTIVTESLPPTFCFSGVRMTVQDRPCWSIDPAHHPVVDGDGRRYTNMNETSNETRTGQSAATCLHLRAMWTSPVGQWCGCP